jgi:hypothetical protein
MEVESKNTTDGVLPQTLEEAIRVIENLRETLRSVDGCKTQQEKKQIRPSILEGLQVWNDGALP